MVQKLKLFFTLFLFLSLVNCAHIYGDKGVIKDRETDYLKAQSIPPLKIPPGYASSTIQENYPVSDKSYPESTKKVSLVPPGLNNPGN